MTDTGTTATSPAADIKPEAKLAAKPSAKKAPAKTATKAAAKPAEPMAVAPVAAAKPKTAPAAKKPGKAKSAPNATAKAAAPVAKATVAAKPAKAPKQKLVRDSFTFPEAEYLTLVSLKKRLLAAGTDVKKGELIRTGLALLNALDDSALAGAVAQVEKLKTGRPAK